MRQGTKWTIGIAATLLGLLALDVFTLPGASWLAYVSIPLPRSRDPRLAGTWRGEWATSDGATKRPLVIVLRADGNGEWALPGGGRQPFRWGTADGVLTTRRMATDAWAGTRHRYTWHLKVAQPGPRPDEGSARFKASYGINRNRARKSPPKRAPSELGSSRV